MFGWFRKKTLDELINETKTVSVKGVRFTIKKIDIVNHLEGTKVLKTVYDVHKTGKQSDIDETNQKKIREHFSHVLVAGVVYPKLTFKKEETGQHVDELFFDWELVAKLYEEIMLFTYGKKKMKLQA